MKRIYNAKISYTIDAGHPDIGSMPEKFWKDKVFTYEDEYRMDPDRFFGFDHMMETIKEDLLLVAGGGYNHRHVHNVEFIIEEV